MTTSEAIDTDEDDDKPASKATFMWLALELQRLDPAAYDELRSRTWEQIAVLRLLLGKSFIPN